MGCCGSNRAALAASAAKSNRPVQQTRVDLVPGFANAQTTTTVSVRYPERPGVVVRGAVTGRQYAFSGTNAVQPVDARDAGAFLLSRFFRRA